MAKRYTKKQRALDIIELLKKEYPDASCTLDYDQAWKLLVSVRLAAQCTDARVNVVVEGLFEKYLQSPDCKFNSDMIPVELAEENTDDLFIYELLKMYAGWGFSDYFENCESMSRRPWCESTKQHLLQLNMQVSALEIQEHRYELDQKRLISPRGMKSGLVLCLLFSFFNIIFPLSLSIFSFSNKVIPFVQASSILLLAIGLVTTFGYFAKMLTWK